MLHHLIAGHHDRPRQRPRLPRRDGARRSASPGGCSGSACSTTCCRCSGRPQPERFPLAGTVLDLAHGRDRPLATTSSSARARPGYDGPALAHPASGVADERASRRADVSGDPLDRLLRLPEHEQADPAAARGVRARCAQRRPGARLLLVGARGRAVRPRAAASSGSGSTDGVDARATTCPRSGMWSLMAACDVLVNLRYADDGRDVGLGDPRRSRSASRCSSPTSAGSRAARRRVLKVPVDELRGADDRGGARARGRPRRELGAAARDVRRARARPRPRRRRLRARARGRRRAATPSTTRCSGGSPRRRPRSASTTRPRARRAPAVDAGHRSRERGVRARLSAVRPVGLAGRDRRRLDRRPDRARAADGRAVDHGRRDRSTRSSRSRFADARPVSRPRRRRATATASSTRS